MAAAHLAIWQLPRMPRGPADAPRVAIPALAVAVATWTRAARAGTAARSTAIAATTAGRAIRPARTTAHPVARRIGVARDIGIRTVTSMAAAACARTVAVHRGIARAADTTTAVAARRPVAIAAHSAAAARAATRTTTSTRARPSRRPLIRTTRCVARAISCSTIRRASGRIDIDLGGKAEGGTRLGPKFYPPASFLPIAILV
jgi:hypothetical protein